MEQQRASNDTSAFDDHWGRARRSEAQLTMRSVLSDLGRPYEGVALADGELQADAFEDKDAACRFFERALVAEMQRMGVGVRKLVQPVVHDTPGEGVEDPIQVTDLDGNVICGFDDEPALNSLFMETVALVGSCSGNVLARAGKVASGIVEACAEMMRAILTGAVVAAFMDDADESDVVVIFHAGPEIASLVDLKTGAISALLRMRGAVYDRNDPTRSYLLGENVERMTASAKAPLQLMWPFPLVEQVYGPNRLRWKDKRSAPSYVLAEKPKLVMS